MTRRCSMCAINYPPKAKEHGTCGVCGEKTTFFNDLDPHEDWEARVLAAQPFSGDSSTVKVAENRLHRFREGGLDLSLALKFAGAREVDLHEFEALVKRGCPPETAARIVAPL